MKTMKQIFIKYWWMFPILLELSMIALIVLFTKTPSILETIIGILLLLVIIALLTSWVLLLINKQWLKALLSFIVSAVVGCILLIPLTLSAMSGPDGFGKDHPFPEGLEYNLPLPFESEKVELVDSLNNKNIFADLERFSRWYV